MFFFFFWFVPTISQFCSILFSLYYFILLDLKSYINFLKYILSPQFFLKWFQSDLSYHNLCSPAPRRSGTLCASGGFEAVAASCSAFRAPLGSSSHAPSAAFAGPPVASRLHGRPRLKIVVHWVQFSHGVCSLLLLASQTRNARFELFLRKR